MLLKSKWLFAYGLLALGLGCQTDVSDQATAKRVAIEEELIGGPGALGGVGDYLLENSKIRVIIQDKGWSRGFGIFGGGIIDADIVRATTGADGTRGQGKDSFGEFFPAFFLQAFEAQEIYPYNSGTIDEPLPAIEVISSGKSGEPAIVRTRARGGDFLRTLSLVNDLVFPDKVFKKIRFETDYILHPGASHVEIVGRVINEGSSRVSLTESASALVAQFNIPIEASTNGEDSTFRLPIGDIALFGSGNSVFTPGSVAVTASETGIPRGFGLRYTLESTWKLQNEQGVQLPAIQGLVVDFIATKGDGVSYGFAVADDDNNYVWKYREQYEKEGGAPVSKHSLLIPFLFSSFTGAYYGLPPDELGAGESYEYTKYLVVGDGDIDSVREELYTIRGESRGEFVGEIVDEHTGLGESEASMMIYDALKRPYSQVSPDSKGRFKAHLEEGTYYYLITAPGRYPVPGNHTLLNETHQIKIEKDADGQLVAPYKSIRIPAAAEFRATVTNGSGTPMPSKITLVGNYTVSEACRSCKDSPNDIGGPKRDYDCIPVCDPRNYLFQFSIDEPRKHTDLNWFQQKDGEYAEKVVYSHDGLFHGKVRPGTYDVYISRGIEYDLELQQAVKFEAGKQTFVEAVLKKTVETNNYISADFHIHSEGSLDSSISMAKRVTAVAAEGLEVAVSTDHNFITDYQPEIAALGLHDWTTSMVGVEMSTLEMGHFNGFPMRYTLNSPSHFPYVDSCMSADASKVNKTSMDWVRCNADQLFDQMRLLGEYGPGQTIIQVNHPRDAILGYFSEFNMGAYNPVAKTGGALIRPVDDESLQFEAENFSYDFDVIEVVNGKRLEAVHHFSLEEGLGDQSYADKQSIHPLNGMNKALLDASGEVEYPGVFEDWVNLLRKGFTYTATGNSDSHGLYEEVGYPRNYVYVEPDARGEPRDASPSQVHDLEMVQALQKHQVMVTNGPYIRLQVMTKRDDGEGNYYWDVGDFVSFAEDTKSARVELQVEIRLPNWINVSELLIYANGEILTDGDGSEIGRIDLSKDKNRTIFKKLSAEFDRDTFVIAEVKGDESMFPVVFPSEDPPSDITDAIAGVLGDVATDLLSFGKPDGLNGPNEIQTVTPLAFTNPIWLDIDGDSSFEELAPFRSPGPATENASLKKRDEGPHATGVMDLKTLFSKLSTRTCRH